MKIKILKTGKISLHSAWGPIIDVEEGQEKNDSVFTKDQLQNIIDLDWGELIEDDSNEDVGNSKSFGKVEQKIHNLIDEINDESEKKSILQDWGMVTFNVKIRKQKNIEKMINELVVFENNYV